MKETMANLQINLIGTIFQSINDQYHREQKWLREGTHMLYPKTADIYIDVFECNDAIKRVKAESFGNIIIDDNHIVVEWDIAGCAVEFYYEQYWDIMELTISNANNEHAFKEIVKAFENYYSKTFSSRVSYEEDSYTTSDGTLRKYETYTLTIEDI